MEEIGEKLRSAREENNISLREINEKTKININMLEAMEKGDFSVFESDVYVTGALRHYAEAVGLDAREIVDQYKQLKKERQETEKGDTGARERKAPKRGRTAGRGFPPVITTTVIIIVIAISWGLWSIFSNGIDIDLSFDMNDEVEENEIEPPNNDENDEEINDIENDNDEEIDEPEPEVELVEEETDQQTYVYRLTGAEDLELRLDFIASCWVDIEADGDSYEMGTYEEGSLEVEAQNTINIHFGNPAGAQIHVNDIRIEDLEDYRGQPRRFRVYLE